MGNDLSQSLAIRVHYWGRLTIDFNVRDREQALMSLLEPLDSAVSKHHSKLLVMSANKFSLVTRSTSVIYTRET